MRVIKFKKKHVFPLVCAMFALIFSLIIFPFFQMGDQQYYRLFYKSVEHQSFSDLIYSFYTYRNTLGTSEPGYFLLVFFFSKIIEKDLLFSIINALFTYLVVNWMSIRQVRWFIIVLLLFNFYYIVLLFSAERLKISLVFLIIATHCSFFLKNTLFAFSVLTHTQTSILLISYIYKKNLDLIKKLFIYSKIKDMLLLVLIVFLISITFFMLYEHVQAKLPYYTRPFSLTHATKPLIFLVLSALYAKKDYRNLILSSSPIIIASLFIGSERLVIFSYAIFLYYALQYHRGLNLGVLLTGFYFLIKSIYFINNIIINGDGFYGAYT